MVDRAPGRTLGLDVGDRRVGVAVSDELGLLASPRTVLSRRGLEHDLAAVLDWLERERAQRIVVGHPLRFDGTPGEQARKVERFVAALAARTDRPIVLWDERLSSNEAAEALRAAGARRKQRQQPLDALAAAIILQNYLDHHAPRPA